MPTNFRKKKRGMNDPFEDNPIRFDPQYDKQLRKEQAYVENIADGKGEFKKMQDGLKERLRKSVKTQQRESSAYIKNYKGTGEEREFPKLLKGMKKIQVTPGKWTTKSGK